jgi:hypothetical protein
MVTEFIPYESVSIDMVENTISTEDAPRSEDSGSIDPGDVDLASLTSRLLQRRNTPPVGYVPGKTLLRDQVIDELDCSAEAAETLVDALEARGFIRFTGSSRRLELEPSAWEIVPNPAPRDDVPE